MILLVTPLATQNKRAAECAAALQVATGEQIVIAESLAQATMLLRSQGYQLVLLDQSLIEAEPDQAAIAIKHLDMAILVPVNLAISGMERVVREVRAALRRRRREQTQARHAAVVRLNRELNGTMTALLLSVELARQIQGLPAAAAERLQSVDELLNKLRRHLETVLPAQEQDEEAEHAAGV